MNDNLIVAIEDFKTIIEDGRWEDNQWFCNLASTSAMDDSVDNGREIG